MADGRLPRRRVTRRRSVSGSRAVQIVGVWLLVWVLAGCVVDDGDTGSGPTSTAGDPTETRTTTESRPPADETAELLDGLAVLQPDAAPAPPYERDDYDAGGWLDFDSDCQSTRHEMLQRESLTEVTFDESGCFVEEGRWIDAWSGEVLRTAEEATIDHVVPLSHAHAMGAWMWDEDTKHRFANDEDPTALVVVSQPTNSAKGNSPPEEWLPPEESTWCRYADSWVRTKDRWDLPVTVVEKRALESVLGECG